MSPAKTALAALAACLLAPAAPVRAGGAVSTAPVVVTAAPTTAPLSHTNRSVAVVSRDQIERSGARSLAELLEHVLGVDVRTRGPGGVQSDLSIRGATFEQVLVLLDGAPLTDPQTGHHLLDIPLALEEIERIEIHRGQGSSTHGPNAFGGVVRIVTRRPGSAGGALTAAAGEHGYLEGRASLQFASGPLANRFAVERRTSDGWRHNTDFDVRTLSWSARIGDGHPEARLRAGWTEKDFGANGFYSDRHPEQRERTETLLFSAGATLGGTSHFVSPSAYWRSHWDEFVLDATATGAARYENRHRTDVLGARADASFPSPLGTAAASLEFDRERIESSRLGDHRRDRLGLAVEQLVGGRERNLRVGLSAWRIGGDGWRLFPGADFGLGLGPSARWHGAVERSFRVPTATELYYESPANVGSPDLEPESAWSYETGLRGGSGPWRWEATAFLRDGSDLIDWTRPSPEEPWRAGNVARVRTSGAELGLAWRAPAPDAVLEEASLGYAHLDSRKRDDAAESRYVLDHLRHQVVLRLGHRLPFGARQRWALSYGQRLAGDDALLVDARLERAFGRVVASIEAGNLLGAEYERVGGVPLPGRWVVVRLSWNFPATPASGAAGVAGAPPLLE